MSSFYVSIVKRFSTNTKERNFIIKKATFITIVSFLIALPFIIFFICYKILVPQIVGNSMTGLMVENSNLNQQLYEITKKSKDDVLRLDSLNKKLTKETQNRAEVESKLAILETARIETNEQLQAVKAENTKIKKDLKVYENIMSPTDSQTKLQCFNMLVGSAQKNTAVTYRATYLKSDGNSTENVKAIAEIRFLTGTDPLKLDRSKKADKIDKLSFSKSGMVSGTIKTSVPATGIRVIDILTKDNNGKILAHCWKMF